MDNKELYNRHLDYVQYPYQADECVKITLSYTEEKTKELKERLSNALDEITEIKLQGGEEFRAIQSRLAIAEKALEEINECEYGDEDKISIIATDALSQIKQY